MNNASFQTKQVVKTLLVYSLFACFHKALYFTSCDRARRGSWENASTAKVPRSTLKLMIKCPGCSLSEQRRVLEWSDGSGQEVLLKPFRKADCLSLLEKTLFCLVELEVLVVRDGQQFV